MPVSDDETLRELLDADTVAVVGCSRHRGKDAHEVPRYLQHRGYRIVPINPGADEILGEPAYDSLGEVPDDVRIDLVDVFRPSDEVPAVVDATIERREQCGDVTGLWLQLGIKHNPAVERAEEAGLKVVQDRCIKIERRRLLG